jgi:hypothetical protein
MATLIRNRSFLSISEPSELVSLDDLRDSDVVFGTRGNGGNTNFIRRLEEKAIIYTQLSKFEKMACIKQLITDWDGRFFMLDADGKCCMVRDISPSSKLYTSVRRMMNYVVKKAETKMTSPPSSSQQIIAKRKASGRKAKEQVSMDLTSKTTDHSRDKRESNTGVTSPRGVEDYYYAIDTSSAILTLEQAAISTLVSLSAHNENLRLE